MSTTTVPIFVTGVTFPRKLPGGIRRAWLELEDDADCHPLKIAVPIEFAREIAEHIPGEEEEECIAQLTVTFGEPEAETSAQAAMPAPKAKRGGASKAKPSREAMLALDTDEMLRARGFWPCSWRRPNGEGVDLTVDVEGRFAFDWTDADPSDRCEIGKTLAEIDEKTKRDAGR